MDRSTLPMLVLLPGMDGTGELFQPFVSALKHRCDTVVVTYPSDIPLSCEDLQAIARQALPTVQPPGFSGQPTADRHRAHPMAQPLLLGRFATTPLRAALSRAISQVSPSVMRARLRSVLNVDRSAQLPRIEVPTVYLRATEDRVVPRAASLRIAELKPQVQVIDVAAVHCLLQVAPVEAAHLVLGFLGAQQVR